MAVLLLASTTAGVLSYTQTLSLAHWNPHWQCFSGNPQCASNATAALTNMLSTDNLDFFNLVELESASYTPPAGWDAIAAHQSCGRDWDTLFFNSVRWRRLANLSGCITPSGTRSFAAGVFQSISRPELVLTVLGAHFPQTLNESTQAYAHAVRNLSSLLLGMYTKNAVLLADTNTEGPAAAAANISHHGVNKSNAQLLSDLGLWPATAQKEPPASPLFKSCCYSDDFSWQGDRIISNFGTVTSSKKLFDPAPPWACGELHKGVMLTLQV
ncbi:hypothetical protein AB1Y20_017378 [Prymnesium parvum]|uniref:Endonuclease/exonuclease/phosphatase domain-containing protein n=1 Tax=Prymnesium parvum TaxID=97485 RepID=A0AB34JNA0_PRYPA